FIWVNYLSKASPEWKEKVGEGTSVAWPTGVGGKGNEGVASYVQRVKGSIGYVEYAYALQNKMTYAQVQNREGNFVSPSSETFKAAAAGADWNKAPGYYLVLTDQPGKNSWPISGATFILMYKIQTKPDTAREVLKFFDWAYTADGEKLADSLDYVPLPGSVTSQIKNTWKAQIKVASGSLPAMQKFGFAFLVDSEWNPVTERFGALVPIVGTLVTSFIALLIGVPVSFGIALFLTELSPLWLKRPLGTAIELLAAIPSII